MLKDSRVLSVVEKWAQEFSEVKKDDVQVKKGDEAENKKSEETKDNVREQTEETKKIESDSVSVKSTDAPASNSEVILQFNRNLKAFKAEINFRIVLFVVLCKCPGTRCQTSDKFLHKSLILPVIQQDLSL